MLQSISEPLFNTVCLTLHGNEYYLPVFYAVHRPDNITNKVYCIQTLLGTHSKTKTNIIINRSMKSYIHVNFCPLLRHGAISHDENFYFVIRWKEKNIIIVSQWIPFLNIHKCLNIYHSKHYFEKVMTQIMIEILTIIPYVMMFH